MEHDSTPGIVECLAPFDFQRTLTQVTAAILESGLIIFAQIDHAEGAKAAGLSMPSTTVLFYGHPKGGTPVMLSAPQTALDLPLRVLIRERDDGRTIVSYRPVYGMFRDAGVPAALIGRLDAAQHAVMDSLQG